MKLSEEFYREKLYPLQDGVLKIVRDLQLPFYLTGGTALSRHYLGHRFSDDLDLFVNADENFSADVKQLVNRISDEYTRSKFEIIHDSLVSASEYTRFYVSGYGAELKIDLVNDVAFHYGDFEFDKSLGKLDSWRNILSNKVSALFRFEIKDFIDIWALSRKYEFAWKEIVDEARYKEASVEPAEISNLFRTFPFESLSMIKWAKEFDYSKIKDGFASIAEDIFYGKQNSIG